MTQGFDVFGCYDIICALCLGKALEMNNTKHVPLRVFIIFPQLKHPTHAQLHYLIHTTSTID